MQLNSKKIIFAAGMIILLGMIFIPSVFAQSGPNAQMVDLKFPCPTGMSGCAQLTDAASSSNPIGTFLNAFYQIALTVSGLLALLMIIAGGVSYAISAGSVDKQSEAKDMITSALYGLALLLGSYLILHTINPKITALTLPGSEPQYGPVATSGPKIAVPNTECIPLNSTTWDPNNTSTLATSTDYGSLEHPSTYLGKNQYASDAAANCKYRVFTNNSTLTISNDDYYDVGLGNLWNRLIGKGGTVVIDPNSTIWQYPYFPSNSTNPSADARCLIYAYQDPNSSSSPNMIGLNTNLSLCYPHPQQIAITTNPNSSATGFGSYDPNALNQIAGCTDKDSCADKYYYHGYTAGDAPVVSELTTCLIKNNLMLAVPFYTYDHDHPICNYTRGISGNGIQCSHARNSCHYGGAFISNDPHAASNQGALAIDFAVTGQDAQNLINGAIVECSSTIKQGTPGTISPVDGNEYEARCEKKGGTQVDCHDSSATHVHMTLRGCNRN